MRILGLLKSDANTEAGALPSVDVIQRMGTFMEEVSKAGILVATDGLKPSSYGKRIKRVDGQVSVIDGPFTESKELVASYALFDVKSWDEAIYWTQRFLEVLGEGECELRPIFEPEDFPADLFPPEEQARENAWREEMARKASATN
jgi:hypothetical protein